MTAEEWQLERDKIVATIETAERAHSAARRLLDTEAFQFARDLTIDAIAASLAISGKAERRLREHEKKRPPP